MVYATAASAAATEKAFSEAEECLAGARECARELQRAEEAVRKVGIPFEGSELWSSTSQVENLESADAHLRNTAIFRKIVEQNLSLKRENVVQRRDLLRTVLKRTQETWKAKKAYAELMHRALLNSNLGGISGSRTRGSVFVRFCDERDMYEMSDVFHTDIVQARRNLPPVSCSTRLGDYGCTDTEAGLTECWCRLLKGLAFAHHVVRNTSNQKLFGALGEKPDISIVHLDTFKSHLLRDNTRQKDVVDGISSSEDIGEEEFSLLGWGPIDVVFELKTEISGSGTELWGPGHEAASQAYQRLCCMRHYPFVVIADKKQMMFFHTSGSSFSTEWDAGSAPFWRRSGLVSIADGLQYLRALLDVLHRDWYNVNSLAFKRVSLVRNVNLGLERFVSVRRPRVVEILSLSTKQYGGASIFVLQGRQMDSMVAKVVCESGWRSKYSVRNLERERRRLLALNQGVSRGVPVLNLPEGRKGNDRGLVEWKSSDEKKYIAIILTPFADGGTLREQRHFLQGKRDGGLILCRIMKRVANILCKTHAFLIDEHHWAMHGDVKPSNILLLQSVMESENPEPLLIDWEHSMLLKEEPDPQKPSSTHKVGEKSPHKAGDAAAEIRGEDPPDYASVFTPAFCARCQHETPRTANHMGPQVDWEALFFTFVFMIDRQKMPWLWSNVGERKEGETEYSNIPPFCMDEDKLVVAAKNKLLTECKDLWKESEKAKWEIKQWSGESVQEILNILQHWARWILNDEMKEPEKVSELVSMFPMQ